MNVENTAPESRSIHDSLGYWTSLMARTMEAEFNQRLSEFGVTRVSWAVLGAVHYDGITTPSELAKFLGIDRAAITRLLDKLVAQDLVSRDQKENDRRSISLQVTPKGASLAVELSRISKAVNAQFSDGLSDEEIEQYLVTVRKMLNNSKVTAGTL
ncbi:MarR family winged helix-turn-helix transcriptional regulator [Primorskyibacter sp. S87]|uniref:MarR family winged helix-turn-helix transcriptional regulator n=1 Tax=Primorskyibacter sp. S87 TaxID=3415126 RepID=UPI003C7E8E5F